MAAKDEAGFYKELIDLGWLIPHTEITEYKQESPPEKIIIKAERIPFILAN